MVIINTEPWQLEENKKPVSVTSESSQRLFGFQDLASEYYQVLRQRSRPRVCRIIWGVVIFILAGFTCYMVYRLIHDYFQYSSFNKSSTEWKENVTLPAITVCNTNFINYTALKSALLNTTDYSGHDDLLEHFDAVMDLLAKYNGSGDIMDYIDYVALDDLFVWEWVEGSIATRFKNTIDSMIIGEYDYSFANKGTNIKNTAKVTLPTELGICFEINDDGEMQQSYNGVNGGFTIDLDANVDDYLPTTATKGFVVFIRDQDETVMLNQGGYIISPGTETFIKLTARSVTRLKQPYGTCKNVKSQYSRYSTTHYETVRECIQRQKIKAMVGNCGCIPWYFANRMYTFNNTDILKEAVEYIESYMGYMPTEEPTATEEPIDSSRKRRSLNMRPFLRTTQRDSKLKVAETSTENSTDGEMSTGYPTDLETEYPTEAEMEPSISEGTTSYSWWNDMWWITDTPISDTDYYYWICNFVEQQVCHNLLEYYTKEGNLSMEDCPEPCAYNEWNVEISSTVFPPTEEYYNRFIKDYIDRDPAPSFEHAREDIARIHIYYDDIKFNNIQQEKAYEPQNFVAEFGGTVDLFIGFSFFTIIQLIEIAIAACFYKCCRKRNNKDLPSIAENEIALHLQAVPRVVKVDAGNNKDLPSITENEIALHYPWMVDAGKSDTEIGETL